MKLIISEVGNGNGQGDREFVLPVVKVGRDGEQCQIVFDRVTWPMVSRHHGEFRFEEGKWLFIDTNSTCGTFVNGQRLKGTTEVQAGVLFQFGAGGPLLSVAGVELDSTSRPIATLELEGVEVDGHIRLDSETTLLGRDPASELPLISASVSRRHAEIRRTNGSYFLIDLTSYNGTFVNGRRISEPTVLADNDRIQLGTNGPILRFVYPAHASENGGHSNGKIPQRSLESMERFETLVAAPDAGPDLQSLTKLENLQAQPVALLPFTRPYISVGRGADNDIVLDSLQISVHHARFIKDQDSVLLEEQGSTNGVYINSKRLSGGRRRVEQADVVQIGPFFLQADSNAGVAVYDTRTKTRIDVVDINKIIGQSAGKSQKLLDAVNLSIKPNQFVGLLGSSGAGKSTLMNVLAGMSSPSTGKVLINDLDLYGNLDSLKHLIGYVPQDDIIHRELTVYRTLLYVARLRLSRDVSSDEVDHIIDEVLELTGLTERRDVPVSRLSGGQRKRVSIAVELITKPSLIFLDEPTSGLDPATEEKIMKLFRRITESGRTVVLTTHNTINVRLFDKIVVLMHGHVVFYGEPQEALAHFKVSDFNDLYEVLQAPDESWKQRYEDSELYRNNVELPLQQVKADSRSHEVARRRLKIADGLRQWTTLTRRYLEILLRDRGALLVLFAQAPVIALLTYLVIDAKATRDFPYFMLALVGTWFGASVSVREIVRERAVYNRERMFNLQLVPYVASKITVLTGVVALQCFLLFATLKGLHYGHLTYLPGAFGGLPHLLAMILTGVVGVTLGLFVSAVVRSSQTATGLVPLLLIPQILFSGLIGVPTGVAKVTGAIMPVTWSFDEMKRFSNLPSLNDEGSIAKFLEARTKEDTKNNQAKLDDYQHEMERYLTNARTNPALPPPRPPVVSAPPVADDLREFVTFTHPWGGPVRNSLVLALMLIVVVIATTAVLRIQDKR